MIFRYHYVYNLSSFYIKNKSLRKKIFFPEKIKKLNFFTESQNIFHYTLRYNIKYF